MSSKTKATATKEEAKPALVPKLRFPEFRGAEGWECGQLEGALSSISNGLVLEQSSDASGFKVTRIETISAGTIDLEKVGLVKTSQDISAYKLRVGDILLSNINSVAHIGKSVFVDRDYDLYHGMNLLRLGVNRTKHDPHFIYYLINTDGIRASLRERANKAVNQASINQTELGKTAVAMPLKPEQQKIAECLSSVDALMAAQARKVDALKTHKKGLMQQLFPREGETQPRLRFPEFQNAGEWRTLPLAALADKIMVGIASAATHAYRETGVPMLRNQNIKEGKIDDSSLLFIDQAYEAAHKNKRLRAGDVITVRTGYPGLSAVVPERYNNAQCFTSLITRPKKAVLDADYLCAFINSEIGKRFILGAEAGGAQKNVNAGALEGLPVYLPGITEQQRITTCLSSLDALITAETQKLEALKDHKKGLMQQLFPSVEEVEA